jgi:hypothetical protein
MTTSQTGSIKAGVAPGGDMGWGLKWCGKRVADEIKSFMAMAAAAIER